MAGNTHEHEVGRGQQGGQGQSSFAVTSPIDERSDASMSEVEILTEEKKAARDEPSFWSLVAQNKPFRLFLASYTANHIGEWLSFLAIVSAVERIQGENGRDEETQSAIGVLVLLKFLPAVFLGPIGGILADGWDRRWGMIVLDQIGALVALLYFVAIAYQSLSMIYVFTIVQESVAALYEPGRSAIIPLLVPDEQEMKKATTLVTIVWSVVASFASGTGGFIIALLGVRACFVLDSLSYITSAIFMYQIGGTWTVAEEKPEESLWEKVTGMLKGGYQYLASSPFAAVVLLKTSAALIYGGTVVLNVSFAEVGDPRWEASRLGILFGMSGIGGLVGPLVIDMCTSMEEPVSLQRAAILGVALVAFGCFFTGLTSQSFDLILLFSFVHTAGAAIVWVNSSLLLQKFSSPTMLGRVSAVDYSMALLAEGLSALATGLAQDHLGISAGCAVLLLGLFGIFVLSIWCIYHVRGGGASGSSYDLVALDGESIELRPTGKKHTDMV